ncbi:MAG: tripartite tricarboxylate transporter substrate binding protein, partial [Betaproteobacteria bacterium]|nr:tripartite tricarboxylate transporter substrate binding protein [Betaproteobacteria bacterium]
GHLSVELLKWTTGTDMVHVPYKGAGPALIDVIGGQVPVMCTSPLPALPHVKSGKLRGLAMTGRTRSRAAPEIPTVAESGVPGYQSSLGYALLGPAGVPQPIVDRLHTETTKVLKLPDMAAQLLAQGADPIGNSPQALASFLKAEIDRWTKVIREANIQPN